jgi:hypothetical protein
MALDLDVKNDITGFLLGFERLIPETMGHEGIPFFHAWGYF